MAQAARFGAIALAAIAFFACSTNSPTVRVEGWSSMSRSEGGSPPQAPVHGHVHRVDDAQYGRLQLVFDEALGAYTVIEKPGHFYHDGVYVRLEDGRWMAASTLDGPWEPRSADSLPASLAREAGHPARHDGGR
jgi:hypothetical protein